MENPIKMDDLEVPVFLETHIYLRKFPKKIYSNPDSYAKNLIPHFKMIKRYPKMWDLLEKGSIPLNPLPGTSVISLTNTLYNM